MSKLFKKYVTYTTDSVTGELVLRGTYTYPAEFSEKKVVGWIAAKLDRAPEAVLVKADGLVEFV